MVNLKQKTVGFRHKLAKFPMRLLAPKLLKNFNEWIMEHALINSVPRPMTRFLKHHFNGKSIVGVEIGLGCGVNASSLLLELNLSRLYSVELGLPYTQNGVEINFFATQFNNTIQKFQSYPQFKLLLGDSVKMATLIHEPLDFVYIDGNHERNRVLQDFWAYYPLVKEGGVIGGHDMTNHNFGVVEALMEICMKLGCVPCADIPDWWFIKKGK